MEHANDRPSPGVMVENINLLTDREWQTYRRRGIGGSDVAMIYGVSPFATRKQLYWTKRGIPHENFHPSGDNWIAKEIGHRMESLIIEMFLRKNPGWKVRYERRMLYHPVYPWMVANVDAIAIDPRDGSEWVLEIKTCSLHTLEKWGDRNENIVPVEYELQGRHYMCVLDKPGVIYVCLGGNQPDGYRQRYILRDTEKEADLIRKEKDFWLNYVIPGIEPPLNDGDDAGIMLGELIRHYSSKPGTLLIPDEFRKEVKEICELDEEMAELRKKERELKKRKDARLVPIVEFLKGKRGKMAFPDRQVMVEPQVTKRTSVASSDLTALSLTYPEAYDKYVKTSETMSWRVKVRKNADS